MEISAHRYFLFWAAISAVFLKLAFQTIDNTELSNSSSPLVMLLFKHSWAIFTCYSSNHALYRSQLSKPAALGSYLLFFINGIMLLVILTGGSLLHCYFPIYAVTSQYHLYIVASNDGRFSSKWKLVLYAWYMIATAFVIVPSFGSTNFKGHAKTFTMVAVTSQNILSITLILKDGGGFGSKWELLAHAWYVIATAFATVPPTTANILTNSSFLSLPPSLFVGPAAGEGESRPTTEQGHDPILILNIFDFNDDNYKYKIKNLVKFAVGLLGTILFQNFFRMNSFEEVVGFLYFAVAWLANTAMLSASHDLGVFNFLLGNAIVGCSVSEFGLRRQTWIAYAASVFLYGLRLKIQSLSFVNTQHGNRKVILW